MQPFPMELLNTILPFVISILIGALIGVDREKKKQDSKNLSSIGIRTSIFISLFGAVAAYLGQEYSPFIFLASFISIFILIISSHIYLIIRHQRIGITTEISSILLFLYGAMCTLGYIRLAIILAILTTLILTMRVHLHKIAENISDNELYDTIKFAIIAFIILPFLPNESYDNAIFGSWLPLETAHETIKSINVLNPYQIWLLVVFISGVSFLGYVLIKIFGSRSGISLTGLFGGMYSSTATSLTLASKSKSMPRVIKPFLAGIILACAISFIKTFIFIRTLNEELFLKTVLPISLMFIYLLVIGVYYMLKSPTNEQNKNKEDTSGFKTPFSLKKALQLTLFIIIALVIAKISLSFAGIELYYTIAILSAFFAIDDPIIVSTAATAGNLIDYNNAKNIVLLVTYLNMAQKAAIVYFFGNKKLFKPLATVFAGLLLVTAFGFLYL
jgi:uncharacterized membrane protein (DUF4010 family)